MIDKATLSKLTEEEFKQLVDAFHLEASSRGWGVILWTPEEIGDADVGHLEDVSIQRGWDFLGTFPDEDEDADA